MQDAPSHDPFTPPEVDLAEVDADARDEAHELVLQRFASWLLLFASGATLFALFAGWSWLTGDTSHFEVARVLIYGGLLFAFASAAWTLRRLAPNARLFGTLGALALVPWLPFGTYLGLRGLHALWSRAGRNVLSTRYAALARARGWAPRPLRAWVPLVTPWLVVAVVLGLVRVLG